MTRFRRIWVLALFALLLSSAAPQAFASWQCEGRTCSTGWSCCCVLPDGSRDPNCGVSSGSTPGNGAAACPTSCNCVPVVSSDTGRYQAAHVQRAPVFHPALLPPTPPLEGLLPSEEVARSIESRGPPASQACLATPPLRGPPVLTLTPIGS